MATYIIDYRGNLATSKIKKCTSPLTLKWHRIFLEEESLQHVFVLEFFFREIDGCRCKSNCIKGRGCSRVQITSKILSFKKFVCIESTCQYQNNLQGFLAFLASFLGTANNTPKFTATSTKIFELHILAPLSTWKNYKELRNSIVVDVVYIGLLEIANRRTFLAEIWEGLWSEKYAIPSGHNTTNSKCNFKGENLSHFEQLDLRPTNFKECACLRVVLLPQHGIAG